MIQRKENSLNLDQVPACPLPLTVNFLMAISIAAPILVAWALSHGALQLRVDRISLLLLAFGVGCLLGAGALDQSRVLVPVAFASGTAALGRIVYATTKSRATTTLAVAGATANLIPISVVGAMPVSPRMRSLISDVPINEGGVTSVKHQEIEPEWWLAAFSDVIPVPGLQAVISLGDLMLVAALVWSGRQCLASARAVTPKQRDRRVFGQEGLLAFAKGIW